MSWRRAALALVFIWFCCGGLGHFLWLDAYTQIVPRWVGYPRATALLTGACDLAGAVGVVWPPTRRRAGVALIGYSICVWPVHFDMLADAHRYSGIGVPALWRRLLFQPVLMAIIWFAAVKKPSSGDDGLQLSPGGP